MEQGPVRLDRFLHQELSSRGFSMAAVRGLIESGRVMVNRSRVRKKGFYLGPGDKVLLEGIPEGLYPLPGSCKAAKIMFEDEWVLVADKPAGMPTAPIHPLETQTLVNAVIALRPNLRGVGDKVLEPGLLHRLDRGTSGLVLFAKNDEAFRFLRRELKMGRIKKIYRALVQGRVKKKQGTIELPLARHPSDPGRMVIAKPGSRFRGRALPAITRWRVLDQAEDVTLVELELMTGVMHQLRVHLAAMGHPVLGDEKYRDLASDPERKSKSGKEKASHWEKQDARGREEEVYALQACRLSFMHPVLRQEMEVRAGRMLELSHLPLFQGGERRNS